MIVILVMAMTMMMHLRDLALRARRVGRHTHELAVPDATLGDDMLAEMLHVIARAPQHRHFETGVVIEMNM